MSIERIDPVVREDLYCVDHLLRYALAGELAKGKRVLDAACGVGFGSVLLAHKEAEMIVGLDNSEEGIDTCRSRWKLENLSFICHDLADYEFLDLEPFDLITSFETLEHVEDPLLVVSAFKKALKHGGILMGSVPGRTDRQEVNPYHLHHFDESSLRGLLRSQFSNVEIYSQMFSIKSSVRKLSGEKIYGAPLNWECENDLKIDFGKIGDEEDNLIFIASEDTLPDMDFMKSASSRAAWRRHRMEFLDSMKELNDFTRKYQTLFLEHGDLKVKFANMLAWGKWHFQQHSGKSPSGTAMDRVVNAMSEREAGLREQIKDLCEDNRNLRVELDRAKAVLTSAEKDGLVAFNKGVDNI